VTEAPDLEGLRKRNNQGVGLTWSEANWLLDEIARLRSVNSGLEEALTGATRAENSNARRMREAVVEARRRLAKGRALWNGPCHECDGVLEQALRADNDAETIRALTSPKGASDVPA
jgi:hypothetical protein